MHTLDWLVRPTVCSDHSKHLLAAFECVKAGVDLMDELFDYDDDEDDETPVLVQPTIFNIQRERVSFPLTFFDHLILDADRNRLNSQCNQHEPAKSKRMKKKKKAVAFLMTDNEQIGF